MIKIGKNLSNFSSYSCQPRTKKELQDIIKSRVSNEGPKCNLNDIDTSLMTDMSSMFAYSLFNGDISKWDVSNVNDMWGMFQYSLFDGDISNWNVSNMKDMSRMFKYSCFKHNISNWSIREDCDTYYMFIESQIKKEYKPKLPK